MSSSIGPKPYLLFSTTCNETLSWMIEIQLKYHWVSYGNCNTINVYPPTPPKLNSYKDLPFSPSERREAKRRVETQSFCVVFFSPFHFIDTPSLFRLGRTCSIFSNITFCDGGSPLREKSGWEVNFVRTANERRKWLSGATFSSRQKASE